MNLRPILIVALFASLVLSVLSIRTDAVSDPIGVFARIDKVVFEPDSTAPERVQIWGAFALAGKGGGDTYQAVQRGYLYFSLRPGKEDVCRKEWKDLSAIAGTDQIIGFGRRWETTRLRKANEKPSDPDVYPLSIGLAKISDRSTDYPPIRELRALPKEH